MPEEQAAKGQAGRVVTRLELEVGHGHYLISPSRTTRRMRIFLRLALRLLCLSVRSMRCMSRAHPMHTIPALPPCTLGILAGTLVSQHSTHSNDVPLVVTPVRRTNL